MFEAAGPAILFERVQGSSFPAVSNLFGTLERARFLLRHTLERVKRIVELKADPSALARAPWRYASTPLAALRSLPRPAVTRPLKFETTIDKLPQVKCWPDDGGPFVTLPQVLSIDPDSASPFKTNVGMYRVQMAGNEYEPNREVGLHFQIHRGIGVHATRAAELGQPLRVSVFVGGPPAHSLAAIMPLPEGLSELLFYGLLSGRAFTYYRTRGALVSALADFCITGRVRLDRTLPEGPFGDHLGYYAKEHPFPVLEVERVLHRRDAVWPFTVVGRPPQEDSTFGALIHEITGPLVPNELPGLREMHAVDEAGVHPLLLAVGSERYTPHSPVERPQEILTIAHAILGFGQASLAKYLLIVGDDPRAPVSTHDKEAFFQHLLERVDWRRDLHFQTETTIDTLDYSGSGLNRGSKVVIAAAGPPTRKLSRDRAEFPKREIRGVEQLDVVAPGILALKLGPYRDRDSAEAEWRAITQELETCDLDGWPLLVGVDESEFVARSFANFLWVTFTRSNPAADIYGVKSFTEQKHWGCEGPIIIDARQKPFHAPPLISDPKIVARVDELGRRGGPLHGVI